MYGNERMIILLLLLPMICAASVLEMKLTGYKWQKEIGIYKRVMDLMEVLLNG